MATTTIEIEDDLIPEGYEAVRVGQPMKGEWFVGSSGTAVECSLAQWRADPRLIVRPLPKKARPYNADEMRELVGKTVNNATGVFIVHAFSPVTDSVMLGAFWYDAEQLRQKYEHLDGRKCEVVE